jgi:hypothetical protein
LLSVETLFSSAMISAIQLLALPQLSLSPLSALESDQVHLALPEPARTKTQVELVAENGGCPAS